MERGHVRGPCSCVLFFGWRQFELHLRLNPHMCSRSSSEVTTSLVLASVICGLCVRRYIQGLIETAVGSDVVRVCRAQLKINLSVFVCDWCAGRYIRGEIETAVCNWEMLGDYPDDLTDTTFKDPDLKCPMGEDAIFYNDWLVRCMLVAEPEMPREGRSNVQR